MSSYISSLFTSARDYLYQQESDVPQNTSRQAQSSNLQSPTPPDTNRYPSNPTDIHHTISLLNHASPQPLPAELLKQILQHASYDSITYSASLTQPLNTIARSAAGPPARACVETPPLQYLGPQDLAVNPEASSRGRIRRLRLEFTGRDQGWTSDPNTASWSWFEIATRRFGEQGLERGPVLAHNAVAGRDWEDFVIEYRRDDEEGSEEGVSEELRQWIEKLGEGDRVAIVPMAKYGGWQCRVSKARIDVEVEVWY
ncbi:uncharacterized protein RCC_07501 [Ramularia collo-cygni]|uniref:Uncharacterized protein n=1 Tax=Ramularia collo-cygni TaxID=112498 RepID=A0A2D3VCY9_9PEZI|nr:uncharacterized protein RCC_07501 [Ramularia collo-cygni]CZT21636.1 uncharacterized protein RCC_07501 [Ramularia collo-cygni]